MKAGCYTAIITPFADGGVDYQGLERLTEFQISSGITGILAVGTTGESPTLNWEEHNNVVESIAEKTKGRCLCIAGTGSNNTGEALTATGHAFRAGVDAVLLVDPYYNGPSSIEIRKEYIAPIAEAFPSLTIIPYVIPGRTGTQIYPEDLAFLKDSCKNVNCVKEATGDIENMRKTRAVCGDDYNIFSGDDALVLDMMTDPAIKACGLISVASNIAPGFTTELVALLKNNSIKEAEILFEKLEPLFRLTTVVTTEKTPYGEIRCRARNPLGIKTAMSILGMPSGGCRRPLGKMTENGVGFILKTLRELQDKNPDVLKPVSEFFNVDINKRLSDPGIVDGLAYDSI